MIKISVTALVRNRVSPEVISLLRKHSSGSRTAYTRLQKPVRDFEATAVNSSEHPLVDYRGSIRLNKKRRGLLGLEPEKMKTWNSNNPKPVRTPDPKPDLHPTEPTTDTVDWFHKKTPTTSTYKKIKNAINSRKLTSN